MDKRVGVIAVLYIGFFALWCAGLLVGVTWTGSTQPLVWGMPVWFLIGCGLSFAAVSLALAWCLWRRYL